MLAFLPYLLDACKRERAKIDILCLYEVNYGVKRQCLGNVTTILLLLSG